MNQSRILQSMVLVFVLVFTSGLSLQRTTNNYTVSVRLLQYRNPESRVGSISRTPCCNIFTCEDCNNRFVFCLRPQQDGPQDDLDCSLGRLESNTIRNDNIEFDNTSEQEGEGQEQPTLFTFHGVSNTSEVQLFTRVFHDNTILPDRLVDWFFINLDLARGASEVRGAQGVSGVSSIVVSLTVTCSDNHYGEFCDVLCVQRNDSQGHYTCDNEGNIVCLPGFTDPQNFCNTTCHGGICVPVAAVAGGVVTVVLFLVIATTTLILVVTWSRRKCAQASEKRKLEHEAVINGVPHNRTSRVSVLGDNPTYVSGHVQQEVTDLNPRTALPGQVHRSRSNRSRTTSHKYDYIVYDRGDDEVNQSQNELAENDSGTYSYIDEKTVRRLLSSEPVASQHDSHLPSGKLLTSDVTAHYETMENSTIDLEPQPQTINAANFIPAHYETSELRTQIVNSADCLEHYATSGPRGQVVHTDIPAHYETMENCVLSDTESCDFNSGSGWDMDPFNHYKFESTNC